jgi:hypothetical protein
MRPIPIIVIAGLLLLAIADKHEPLPTSTMASDRIADSTPESSEAKAVKRLNEMCTGTARFYRNWFSLAGGRAEVGTYSRGYAVFVRDDEWKPLPSKDKLEIANAIACLAYQEHGDMRAYIIGSQTSDILARANNGEYWD